MRFKTTLILAIVFVILLGYVYYFEMDESVSQEEEIKEILNVNRDDISQIKLIKGDEVLKITRQEDKWVILEPRQVRADQNKLNRILDQISNLKSDRLIVEGENLDLSSFGLDEPTSEVEVVFKNNSKEVLLIGDPTPVSGGYYLMKKGGDKIYRAKKTTVNLLNQDLHDLRDNRVFTFDFNNVRKIEIVGSGNKKISLVKREGNWEMLKPYSFPADSVDFYINRIKFLEAKEFIYEPETEEQYGLSEPVIIIRMFLDQDEIPLEVMVGQKEEKTYIRHNKEKTIYRIDKTHLSGLKREAADFINKELFDFNSEKDVEYVKISVNSKNIMINPEKSLSKEEDTLLSRINYFYTGDVRGIYTNLKEDLSEPYITMTLKLKDTNKIQLSNIFRVKKKSENRDVYKYFLVKEIKEKEKKYDKLYYELDDTDIKELEEVINKIK